MNFNPAHEQISEEDYLQGELLAEIKHEYIDGEVHVMAGASENHNLLALNMASELRNQLKGTPCRTFMANMKVKVGQDFFYPDVMVVCQQDNENEYYKTAPVIIVEVLSKSTRRYDQTEKRLRCQRIPTL
jgi:Uma2 family endonuclease